MSDYVNLNRNQHDQFTIAMNRAVSSLEESFRTFVDAGDVSCKLKQLKAAIGTDYEGTVLRELWTLLDELNIRYDKNRRDYTYYDNLAKRLRIPASVHPEYKMIHALYEEFVNYPTPVQYMKRLVDRLCHEQDGWNQEPLRVRILKQFIKYGDGLADVLTPENKPAIGGRQVIKKYIRNHGGTHNGRIIPDEDLVFLDDGIFEEYHQVLNHSSGESLRELKKYKGRYGLIKIADDLASGHVVRDDGVKRCLYWFAMVYGMTYSIAENHLEDTAEKKTDIVDNFFVDYYTTNLLRYILSTGDGNENARNIDPAGYAVNYKNFAEMICLYYIHRNIPLSHTYLETKSRESGRSLEEEKLVQERILKIRLSTQMINELITGQQNKLPSEYPYYNISYELKKKWMKGNILNAAESEFKQYLATHYICSTNQIYSYSTGKIEQLKNNIGLMQIEHDQNSAYESYLKLLDYLMYFDMTVDYPDLSVLKRIYNPEQYAVFEDRICTEVLRRTEYCYYCIRFRTKDTSKISSRKIIIGKILNGKMIPHLNYFRYFEDRSSHNLLIGRNDYIRKAIKANEPNLPDMDFPAHDPLLNIYEYGIWFADIQTLNPDLFKDKTGAVDAKQFNLFIRLLKVFNEQLTLSDETEISPTSITRSKLLTAFYYAFNKQSVNIYGKGSVRGFREICKDFEQGANTLLKKCNYLEFNKRNLFDILLAFSAYAYTNL